MQACLCLLYKPEQVPKLQIDQAASNRLLYLDEHRKQPGRAERRRETKRTREEKMTPAHKSKSHYKATAKARPRRAGAGRMWRLEHQCLGKEYRDADTRGGEGYEEWRRRKVIAKSMGGYGGLLGFARSSL